MDVQKNLSRLDTIDIFDEGNDYLNDEEKDYLLERTKREAEKHVVPTVPCQCNMCDNWIDETELYYIVGWENDSIICLECAEPIFIREDYPPVRYDDYYDF